MNLTELITSFKSKTGRLDLTDSEITDYLNSACKVLDQLENSGKRPYRYFIDVAANAYIVALPSSYRDAFKAILHTPDEAAELSFVPAQSLMTLMRAQLWDISDYQNTFSVITAGLISDLPIDQLPLFADTIGVQTQPSDRNLYLLLYPKTTVASIVELEVSAYTSSLSDTNTSNYWSNTFPGLIIQACQYLLIKDLINIDESTKIYNDLAKSVQPIVFDYYEQEHITQMEG